MFSFTGVVLVPLLVVDTPRHMLGVKPWVLRQ